MSACVSTLLALAIIGARDAEGAGGAVMPSAAAGTVRSESAPAPPHRALATGFEPDPALPSELPPGFFRLLTRESGREGFPPFGRVSATDARASEGRWALEFHLAGGAMSVVNEPALVPAAPGEAVDASVSVLMDGLERSHAGAVISALDAAGKPIGGAAWRSAAERTRGWQRLDVRAGPFPEGTKSLEVALEVRPDDPADPTGDVGGSALFDDLQIWRVPRVRLSIDRAGAPIGEQPRAAIVSITDPAHSGEVGVRLLDCDDREVAQWTLRGEGDGRDDFEIPLPQLGAGGYQLIATMEEAGRTLVRASRTVAVGNRPARRAPRDDTQIRFGLSIERPTPESAKSTLDSLLLVRPDFVTIELGDGETDMPGLLGLADLRRWCDELRLEGIEPILRFSRVPSALARELHVEANDPAGVFERQDDSWRRAYGPWFERFGHVQPRWMVASNPPRAVAIGASLDGLVKGFVDNEPLIEVIDAATGADRSAADGAASQAIERWRSGSTWLALRGAVADEPSTAALVWGALASAARGAASTADLDAGSDIGCLLLSCDHSARVLCWRRDGGSRSPVTLPFDGEAMFAVDALGAPVELERRNGAVVAEVGSTPVIIDGVDPTLGAFLASIRFEPAIMQGSTAEQTLSLRFTNPWDVTWEGTLRFVAPFDWAFVPRFQRCTLAPGASLTIAAKVTLPRSEITGMRRVGVELEFTADRGRSIRIDPTVEIRVDDFTCEAQLRRVTLADGRHGAVVEVTLSNRCDRALDLETTVSTMSGTARRDGPVRLEAGTSAKRMVRLDESPSGPVIVSVGQTNGPLRLVRTLQ